MIKEFFFYVGRIIMQIIAGLDKERLRLRLRKGKKNPTGIGPRNNLFSIE